MEEVSLEGFSGTQHEKMALLVRLGDYAIWVMQRAHARGLRFVSGVGEGGEVVLATAEEVASVFGLDLIEIEHEELLMGEDTK